VIRAYVQEEAEIANFETANHEYIRRSLKLVRLMGMLWPTLELMLGIAVVIVAVAGRTASAAGTHIGRRLRGFQYLHGATHLAGHCLGWVINIFQRGTASLIRINEILSAQPEIADDPALVQTTGQPAASLPSGGSEPARTNGQPHGECGAKLSSAISTSPTTVCPAERHQPAGCGGQQPGDCRSDRIRENDPGQPDSPYYDGAPGTVLIDGRPIREFPLETLRRNIGFVPQETSCSVTPSGKYRVSAKTKPAFQRSRLPPKPLTSRRTIEGFPKNTTPRWEERGITLSGGQKQRTAIARAICGARGSWFSTTALSAWTRTRRQDPESPARDHGGRTTIFISHRVSTVRKRRPALPCCTTEAS